MVRRKYTKFIPKYLVLRNGIFYYRMDKKQIDGRWKAFRKSLNTNNLSEALDRMKVLQMEQYSRIIEYNGEKIRLYYSDQECKKVIVYPDTYKFLETLIILKLFLSPVMLREAIPNLEEMEAFYNQRRKIAVKAGSFALWNAVIKTDGKLSIPDKTDIEHNNDITTAFNIAGCDINEFYLFKTLDKDFSNMVIDQCSERLLDEDIVKNPEEYMPTHEYSVKPIISNAPKNKISDLIERMLVVGGNVIELQSSKRNALKKMIGWVGLSIDDDYSAINSREMIDIISAKVQIQADLNNDSRRKYLGFLRELVTFANGLSADHYKLDILGGLPKIKKTPKGEKNPHMPFNDIQLSEIFNPKHNFFHEHPEEFLGCLIGLFTCSRTSASITLQYADIVNDDIPYIDFRKNHELKKLKTDATERKVPIAEQLLDFGFIELIKQRQVKTGAKDTDFIFTRTTKYKEPDKKFFFNFFRFLEDIGIKTKDGKKYDFHSFRNTLSNKLKDAGVEITRINAIGGWDGIGTVQTNYSKHELVNLKKDVDKIHYDCLHLDYWKPIISKAYIEL